MDISASDLLYAFLFFLPIAILAFILTPFSRSWMNNKRDAIVEDEYRKRFKDEE